MKPTTLLTTVVVLMSIALIVIAVMAYTATSTESLINHTWEWAKK